MARRPLPVLSMLLALGVGIIGGVAIAVPSKPTVDLPIQYGHPTDVASATITPRDIYGNPK